MQVPLALTMLPFVAMVSGLRGDPKTDFPHGTPARCGAPATAVGADSSGPIVVRVSARFTLSGAGYDETVTYTDDANLVLCQEVTATMWWIRLAEVREDNGEHGPHLDIDLCNAVDDATFTPMNPRGQPCPGGLTWGIWWHDGPDVVYANRAESTPCELQLQVEGDVLEGTFNCRGLASGEPGETLDILDGWFRCQRTTADDPRLSTSAQDYPPPSQSDRARFQSVQVLLSPS